MGSSRGNQASDFVTGSQTQASKGIARKARAGVSVFKTGVENYKMGDHFGLLGDHKWSADYPDLDITSLLQKETSQTLQVRYLI